MAKIKRRRNPSKVASQSIHINFDSRMLDSMLKYIVSDCVTTSEMNNLRKLMEKVDLEDFQYSQDKYDKVRLIKYVWEAKSIGSLQDTGAIAAFVLDKCPELGDLLDTVNWDPKQIAPTDTRQISKSISEKLQYSIIMSMEDGILHLDH